jgi:Tfp pilus assembly protein PilF
MQTYGFMRIYDIRTGENDRTTARLDRALCIAMFAAGVVFSDTRMFGVASAMWQSGLPLFGPEALATLRWIVGAASAVVALLYAVHLGSRRRRGVPINGVKLLLAASTGWFYWYCGRLSTNVLVGIAMFEIYHAVQYNAIVWIYNRRLFERVGERFGPLGFLFRDRRAMLGIYLATIAAYSSIRFFTAEPGDHMFGGDLYDARQGLIALFVTSSFLHFYYDGFIWKVSDQKTRQPLADDAMALPAVDRLVPSMVHALKWAVLLAIAVVLLAAERAHVTSDDAAREAADRKMLAALAELTPEVPEAKKIAEQLSAQDAEDQYVIGLEFLKQGNAEAAIAPLREAVKLEPAYFQAHLQLGDALLAAGKHAAAVQAYSHAVRLRPDVPDAHIGLADAQIKLGRLEAAEAALRNGLTRKPDSPELCFTLGVLLQHTGRSAEAAGFLRHAADAGLTAKPENRR